MELKDIARRLPDEIWRVFEPILPPVAWVGNGRKPRSNPDCLHGILYVLVAGIPWEMMPAGFPSCKTCLRRLGDWFASGCFLEAWRKRVADDDALRGINGDRLGLDGSKHPAKKGARLRARVR